MKIGILLEMRPGETRVASTPEVVIEGVHNTLEGHRTLTPDGDRRRPTHDLGSWEQ